MCARRYRPESLEIKHRLCPVCAFFAGFKVQEIWDAYVQAGYEELNDRVWMDLNAQVQDTKHSDTCGWCRYPFAKAAGARVQVYCTPECGAEANRARSRERARLGV